MTDTTTRMEREVEAQRHEVESTIEALRDRASPGQLLDQLMHNLGGGRGQAGRMVENFGRQVRDNPLPIALMGLGAAMLATGGPSYGHGGDGLSRTAAGAGRATSDAAHGARQAAASAGSGVRHAAGSTAESARTAAARAGESARRTGAGIAESASAAGGAAADALGEAGEEVAWQAGRARRTLADFIVEQPLFAGGIALAVGAAIGAALPPTRVEDETVGPWRDDLRDQAGEAAREAYGRAETAAEKAWVAGKEEARAEGLVPEGQGGDERPVAERAGEVAKAAADAAREEVDRARDEVGAGTRQSERTGSA